MKTERRGSNKRETYRKEIEVKEEDGRTERKGGDQGNLTEGEGSVQLSSWY